jgi:hypothetical protein
MERILRQGDMGDYKITVFQETRIRSSLRRIFGTTRTVEVPSPVCSHLYEPAPLELKNTERVEVTDRTGKVVIRG